jgi:ferredoxin-NADP reductase
MSHVALLMQEYVTHDTHRFIVERPKHLSWEPGQGVELAIDNTHWRDEGHPFTPISQANDRVVEFMIKRYDTDGLTQALHQLEPGSGLVLSDSFGSIRYRGPGVFIAAGTGITPFLAIFRQLALKGELEQQHLISSNKSEKDLICGDELRYLLGERALFTFTREHEQAHDGHHIDAAFLSGHIDDLDQLFYVCGPNGFVETVSNALITLGVHPDRLIYEQ